MAPLSQYHTYPALSMETCSFVSCKSLSGIRSLSVSLDVSRGSDSHYDDRFYDWLLYQKQTCEEPTTDLGIGKEKHIFPQFI
jgi:hypothetical protein